MAGTGHGGYFGRQPSDSSVVIAKQVHQPTGVQTDFTFASGYTVGYMDCYINGSRLIEPDDYTAADGSTVGLTTAATSGDVLELVAYKAFDVGSVTNANASFNVAQNLTVSSSSNLKGPVKGFPYTAAPYDSTEKEITVTVATKTSDHRYYGSGDSSGYVFDGYESPFITLTPGNKYRFNQTDSTNSGHQIRFYLEADRTTLYSTGVTYNGTAGTSGAYTEIDVMDATPIVLHYQCVNHAYMGNSMQVNSNVMFNTGITTSTGGFVSAAATSACKITFSGQVLTFNVPGVGSTTLTLY